MPTSDSNRFDVSVVVPIFNRRDAGVRAVESLLEQAFSGSYEIIVVDDGSEDGSGEVLEKLDPRVRVIRQTHQGAAAARAAGIASARAPVVTFLDSDDLATPHKLAALSSALLSEPDAVLAFGITEDHLGRPLKTCLYRDDVPQGMRFVIDDPLAAMLGSTGPVVAAMNIALRTDAARACSADRSFYRAANDYDLELRAAQYGKFVFVATPTQVYSPQGDSISSTYGLVRQHAYALHAGDDLFCRLNSPSPSQRQAWQRRVERDWTLVVLGLALLRDWSLLRVVWPIGNRHVRFTHLPGPICRACYWLARRPYQRLRSLWSKPPTAASDLSAKSSGNKRGACRDACESIENQAESSCPKSV